MIFFLSRILFFAKYPHFYDSFEYLHLSKIPGLFQAIASSHESVHPVYIFFVQLVNFFNLPISLVSVFFGCLGTGAFYLLIKRLFDHKTACLTLLPLTFFPHLWLVQTNILHESVGQAFFLVGLLFFAVFLENKKIVWFIFSILAFSLAVTNFVGILLWFPVVFGLVFLKSRKHRGGGLLLAAATLLLAALLATGILYLLLYFSISNPLVRLKTLFISYGGGSLINFSSSINILRTVRNLFSILVNGYSPISIGVIVWVFYRLLTKKKYKTLLFFASFFLPFFLTGSFWYGGLFGRYSSLIAYPIALMFASIPNKKIYRLSIFFLIIFFLPTFYSYQFQKPVPEVQKQIIQQSKIGPNDLLILSDYQRPQLSLENALYVNNVNNEQQKIIEEKIEEALNSDGRVFISQQAIDFPYLQYDGQQIHIVSKGNKNKAVMKDFLRLKKAKLVTQDKNYPLLSIYRLHIQ